MSYTVQQRLKTAEIAGRSLGGKPFLNFKGGRPNILELRRMESPSIVVVDDVLEARECLLDLGEGLAIRFCGEGRHGVQGTSGKKLCLDPTQRPMSYLKDNEP